MIVFFFGVVLGLVEIFLFVYLVEFGVLLFLFSVLVVVYCILNVVMYYGFIYFFESIGYMKMFIFGLLIYVLRFYYFFVIENFWLVLLIEFFCGLCLVFVWCVLVFYVGIFFCVGVIL